MKHEITKQVADAFKERLKELNLSQNRFVESNDFGCRPTLRRILEGKTGSNITTVAHYANKIGLELIIRKKDEHKS